MPSSRFCGKYATMSDTRARANRFALALGSLARKGLIGGRAGVAMPAAAGVLVVGAPGGGGAAAAGLDSAGVGCARVGTGGVTGRGIGARADPALGVANGGMDAAALGGV